MLPFLLFYLTIYGGAHAYLLSRTVRGFHLAAPCPAIFLVVSVFMVLAPILVRVLERSGMDGPARFVAHLGYLWMGFFFLFLSASLALDLVRGVLAAAGWLWQRDLMLPEARLLTLSICLALAASLYGFFEARSIRVERVTLHSAKLPKDVGRVRIVQISDVHLGIMFGKEGLRRVLDKVAELGPDLLLCTGDLVDGQMDGLGGRDEELSALHPPLGKFAVLGNHEVFAGVAPSVSFTRRSGFRLLRGEAVAVADFLTVAGVDDPALPRGAGEATEQALLASLPRDRFTILLKHRPTVEQQSRGLFDLQLSGHVHKGQIFPFNLITHLVYPVKMGLSGGGAGSLLYVSRGSGTWGPPLRVLAPPEVTVIDLLPAPR
ncbi:MAG TPA: metallophosphoesterase [Geomonas sp.]